MNVRHQSAARLGRCSLALAALLLAGAVPAHAQATQTNPIPTTAPGAPSELPPLVPPTPEGEIPVVPPVPVEPPLPPDTIPPAPSADRNAWKYIIIHHSASPGGNAAQFNKLHRSKGWDGVAYHFVIDNGKGGPDGRLEVSPRWWKQKHGAHAGALPANAAPDVRNGYNEFGIGICLVGNMEHRPPTRAQMQTLARLVAKLRTEFNIPAENIVGHGHVKSTACPGRHLPWRTLFAMLNLPEPHLSRRVAVGTYERCTWCSQQTATASAARPSARPGLPASELPPRVMLNTQ